MKELREKGFINGEYKESFKDYCISQTKLWLMAKKYGCKLSEVSQADYIRGLRQRFGCGVGQMAELFGCKKQDLILKAELLGIDLSGARPAKDPNKIYAWAQFTGKIPPDGGVTRIEADEEGDEIPDTQDAQETPEKRGVTVKALKLAFTGTLDRALMELEVYADVLAGETVTVTVELEEV